MSMHTHVGLFPRSLDHSDLKLRFIVSFCCNTLAMGPADEINYQLLKMEIYLAIYQDLSVTHPKSINQIFIFVSLAYTTSQNRLMRHSKR